MRSDVEVLIKNKSAKDTDSVFSTYKNSTELGKKIYHSYKERRVSVNGKNVFYADDKTKSAGYLSNIYGNTGLLSLVNRMNVKLNKADSAELIDSVLNIIDYIEENGFTLEPYISSAENRVGDVELFNLNYPYTGAMTWALSLFVSTRKLIASDLSVLTKAEEERSYAIEKGKEYTPESDEDREKRLLYTRLNKKLVVMIKDIVHTFNETFIEDGDKMGWAFTRGCKTPSLFFTYSVLEAYSDFDDNIISLTYETDENGEFVLDKNGEKIPVYADPELLEAINRGNKGEPLHEQWRDKCFKVADKTWEIYKEVLKDSFVDDTFLDGFKPISRDDILKSNSSNALFNTIYLVFILFYGYVNTRKADAGDEVGANDVIQTMNAALQNVQRVYDQFKRDGIEYIVDTYYIGFKSKVNDKRREDLYTKHLNAKMLVDAKLMPTLVKANNVIAYYIERYPVKQMSILFEQLLDNLPATEGVFVWESSLYDVKYGDQSARRLAYKLTAKGVDRDTAARATAYLAERGYIHEDDTATLRAEQDLRKGWGERRIREDLIAHGFTREAVEEAIESLSDVDWVENCAAVIRKKYGEIPEDKGERQKLMAAMMRLGYDADTVKAAARRILREN